MKVAYPQAQLPTVQLSLVRALDPTTHLRMGRALSPLRDEGVFIIGSGMSFHNLRTFRDSASREVSEVFDAWLQETATMTHDARDARLTQWANAPMARDAHPREEHLLPRMVVAGAAGTDIGRTGYNDVVMGVRVSALHFG